MGDKTTRCPICGKGRLEFRSHDVSRWDCGTIGPDECGEYYNGTRCDKTVFRNDFLRVLAIIEDIAKREVGDCGAEHLSVVIPRVLWNKILHECRGEGDDA